MEVADNVTCYIADWRNILWREINPDSLDEECKYRMKLIGPTSRCAGAVLQGDDQERQGLPGCCAAHLAARLQGDAPAPLGRSPSDGQGSRRHADPDLPLGGLLGRPPPLHERCRGDPDQAVKEEKMENTLAALSERWRASSSTCRRTRTADVPLQHQRDDFELLEADQLTGRA